MNGDNDAPTPDPDTNDPEKKKFMEDLDEIIENETGEEDGRLGDELAYHSLHCRWCGEEIKRFYIEPSDTVIPEKDDSYVCSECGNETRITSVEATLDVGAEQGRHKEAIQFEHDSKQAKYRDSITALRRDWTKVKSRFTLRCSLFGHTWTVVARGMNNGSTSYDGVKNAMAYCRVCDHRHDSLIGDIAWVTGVD